MPLIYDTEADIYNRHDISFETVKHLDDIGLVSRGSIGYRRTHLPKRVTIHYHSTPINIEFPKDSDNGLDIGKVLLSQAGQELAQICEPQPIPDFLDYVIGEWSKRNYVTSCPYPREIR